MDVQPTNMQPLHDSCHRGAKSEECFLHHVESKQSHLSWGQKEIQHGTTNIKFKNTSTVGYGESSDPIFKTDMEKEQHQKSVKYVLNSK